MTSSVSYATAEEVFASFGQLNQDDKPQVNRLIEAISRAIDGYMNRAEYGFVALAEDDALPTIYPGTGERWLYVPEFIGVPSVSMKTSLDSATYDFSFQTAEILPFRGDYAKPNYNRTPYHGLIIAYNARRLRFTNGCIQEGDTPVELPTVQITARWGHSETVPAQIKEATIMQAERHYKRERAGMGDAVYNEQLGQFGFFKELDPEVKFFLDKTRLKLHTAVR